MISQVWVKYTCIEIDKDKKKVQITFEPTELNSAIQCLDEENQKLVRDRMKKWISDSKWLTLAFDLDTMEAEIRANRWPWPPK